MKRADKVKLAGDVTRQDLGEAGEGVAIDTLQRGGWRVEARNWRCSIGEIDIVASRHGTLCFIEVKTRRAAGFGAGSESILLYKQRRLARLAAAYCQSRRLKNPRIEFGVVSILWNTDPPKVDFIRHAFEAIGLY